MPLQLVGAGLGRTGTQSLKIALEQLLGGRCYHMMEVFGRPEDVPVWHAAAWGDLPDWDEFLAEFDAAVDWPASAFWRELAEANPDAVVLLSTRSSADAWWTSANDTIFQVVQQPIPDSDEPGLDLLRTHRAMVHELLSARFTPDWTDAAEAKRAYEAHNAAVRAGVDPARLVEWSPGDGWEPICAALGVEAPDTPFPHLNSTAEFRAMSGLDAPA